MSRALIKSLAVLAIIGMAGIAQAGVMINFGANANESDTQSPAQALGLITGTNWNSNIDGDAQAGLVNDDGSDAGLCIDVGIETTGTSQLISWDWDASNETLGDHKAATLQLLGTIYQDNARSAQFMDEKDGQAVAVRISGLAAGSYDFFVVSRNTYADATGPGHDTYDIIAGTTTATGDTDYSGFVVAEDLDYTTGSNTSWVENVNYVKISLDVVDGEDVVLVAEPTNTSNVNGKTEYRGFINMVQIVPEPTTLALLAIGGLAAIRKRK
ncbi:MAG: PEP-CTERM sorting domain-containing protein [Phycisphaerae bacterium]